MSGFGAWAASIQGTAAIAACTLVLGMLLGWAVAWRPRGLSRRERRELADRVAARAARQFRLLRDPDEEVAARRAAMSRRVYPVFRGTRGGTVMPYRPAEVAHEWEPVHVGQALAVANGDPITTGEIRAITEEMDVFMARLLGEHPVPWPDGSGQ